MSIASTTKDMTVLLACEAAQLPVENPGCRPLNLEDTIEPWTLAGCPSLLADAAAITLCRATCSPSTIGSTPPSRLPAMTRPCVSWCNAQREMPVPRHSFGCIAWKAFQEWKSPPSPARPPRRSAVGFPTRSASGARFLSAVPAFSGRTGQRMHGRRPRERFAPAAGNRFDF